MMRDTPNLSHSNNNPKISIGDTGMFASMVAASSSPGCPNIYTVHLRYPRFIHSEVMTHRVFSRNARSSRAVPIQKMIDEVRDTPVVPWHWGKNQKGMQATEECSARVEVPEYCYDPDQGFARLQTLELAREDAWRHAAAQAASRAEEFKDAGYHKQIVNRLLEPFMWIDTLVTATDWYNFLWLRDHKDAEPHIRDLAIAIKFLIVATEPRELKIGQWHLPYTTEEERSSLSQELLQQISAARSARMSYKAFDGTSSVPADVALYNKLTSGTNSPEERIHASPLEHQATPDPHASRAHQWGNFRRWIQHRKTIPGEYFDQALSDV